jgi:ligand-binding sensor domain-containing protein
LKNSNTSRDGGMPQRWPSKLFLAVLAAVCSLTTAQALDPNRAMVQYIHDRWGPEQGFPGGAVYSIAQTTDGYLWIGAERGLVRFDGLSFRLIKQSESAAAPAPPVLGLTTDTEGNLWIRAQNMGLLRYRDGVFQDVLADLGWADTRVTAMCRARNGHVLFLAPSNGALTYTGGKLEMLASTARLPHFLVISMADAADGKLWTGTRDIGLFYLSGGGISAVAPASPDRKINCLLPH